MSIKKILVPLFDSPGDRQTLLCTMQLAQPLGAHVTAMFSGGYLSELVSEEPPRYGRVKPRLQIEARELLAAQTQAAREAFNALVAEQGFKVADAPGAYDGATIGFEAWRGSMDVAIQEAAVFHDVVVFHLDSVATEAQSHAFATLKSALQDCGRPLLVLPTKISQPFAKTVAIAWNGSIQAAHAVSAALPFLTQAQSVHVLTAATAKTLAEQAAKLQNYLGWHGIQAQAHTVQPGNEAVGAALLKQAEAVGADLLVLGGYTHSRIRQTILGGVTHYVLHNARIPVFLSR